MNPHDPFQQPQGSGQPQSFGAQPNPARPSIQPQAPNGPIYDAAPGMQQMPVSTPAPFPQQQSAPLAPQPAAQPNVNTLYTVPPKPSKLWMIISIILIVIALGLAGAFVWSMLQYIDQRDNVDSKVTAAVTEAVKKQADKDAADFLEKEKQPNRLFVGPDDYGRLSFNYPKTWSTYVDKDALKGGTYAAYLNPVVVPPVSTNGQQYALRVLIEEKDYDKVIDSYKEKVKKGDLKSSAVKADEQNGTRLDGQFTKDIRGSAVIFKIRDKTVSIQTDAEVFKGDFDALIKTITFNK
ncbi:hypothetical protein KI440_03075 [Candidatus Saccharibacteria bacterium TM7i]|nr:hypothetical protein KI440_03075 [Candidatus Saccharibacteria bacterium TM7i]